MLLKNNDYFCFFYKKGSLSEEIKLINNDYGFLITICFCQIKTPFETSATLCRFFFAVLYF